MFGDLTQEQINLLISIVKERQRMTEYMLHFCMNQWSYIDKDVHVGYMSTVWHKCEGLVKALESMKEINQLADDLIFHVESPDADNQPRIKRARRSSRREESKPGMQ